MNTAAQTFSHAQELSREKGSRILNNWRAERQAIRAQGENSNVSGLSAEQLYETLLGSVSHAGPAVTEKTAMLVSTVYACVALKAGALASMPATIYERTEEGRKKAKKDNYWWMFNEQTNPNITASTFWRFISSSLDFNGDAFAEILRPSIVSSRITGFKPLHPLRVQPFFSSRNELYYRITPGNGRAQYVLDPADMIHVPSVGFDGLRSPSPITWAARQNIGIALAAEEYSAKFFSNGATSDIALKVTNAKLTAEQAEVLRTSYMARNSASGGKNYHVPIVLSGGIEVENLSINPEDAALITTRQFTVEEICRALSVPPDMVGHAVGSQIANNIEQKSINFIKYTMLDRLNSVQQEFNRKVWPFDPALFLEFNTAGLERGDIKSRYEAYRIGVGRAGEKPFFSVNDIRALENLPPVPGGDSMEPVGKAQPDQLSPGNP